VCHTFHGRTRCLIREEKGAMRLVTSVQDTKHLKQLSDAA